jgi:hypothetical protein
MDAVGDALAYAVPLVPPPAELRDRVLLAVEADLASSRREQRRSRRRAPSPRGRPAPSYSPGPWPAGSRAPPPAPKRGGFLGGLAPALAFAGVLVGALSGVYALKLRSQLALVRRDLERVQAENQELARVMDVVDSPRCAWSRSAARPVARRRGPRAVVARRQEGRALRLRPAQAARGQDYQLWVIEGSTPRSEGVFPVDDKGQAQHVLPEVPAAAGWARSPSRSSRPAACPRRRPDGPARVGLPGQLARLDRSQQWLTSCSKVL